MSRQYGVFEELLADCIKPYIDFVEVFASLVCDVAMHLTPGPQLLQGDVSDTSGEFFVESQRTSMLEPLSWTNAFTIKRLWGYQ